MSVNLTVNGVTYAYPTNNDELWGVQATNWAVAVTSALATATSQGDLSPTTLVTIQNNQPTPTNVTGLLFDKAIVRSAEIEYYVYRVRGATEVLESGTIRVGFKTDADTWYLNRTSSLIDEVGVHFDITTSGQVTYTSTDISTSGTYAGAMRYRARVLPV